MESFLVSQMFNQQFLETIAVYVACSIFLLTLLLYIRSLAKKITKLEASSGEDKMTGLTNKQKMYTDIEHQLTLRERLIAKGNRRPDVSVVFIDLDDFSAINTRDHILGDQLIIEFANVLKSQARKGDGVARFGGDEFCLFANDTDKEHAEKFAKKIEKFLLEYVSMNLAGYHFKASIGVASTSEGLSNSVALVGTADKRMANQKASKKGSSSL